MDEKDNELSIFSKSFNKFNIYFNFSLIYGNNHLGKNIFEIYIQNIEKILAKHQKKFSSKKKTKISSKNR